MKKLRLFIPLVLAATLYGCTKTTTYLELWNKETYKDEMGTTITDTTREYNKDHLLTHEVYIGKINDSPYIGDTYNVDSKYTYNDHQDVIREEKTYTPLSSSKSNSFSTTCIYSYTYNKQGLMTSKKISRDGGDNAASPNYFEYQYDDLKRMSKETIYMLKEGGDKEKFGTYIWEYKDQFLTFVSETYDGHQLTNGTHIKTRTINDLDDKGYPITTEYYILVTEEKLMEKYTYQYGKNHCVEELKIENFGSTLLYTTVITTTYHKDNPNKPKTIKTVTNKSANNGKGFKDFLLTYHYDKYDRKEKIDTIEYVDSSVEIKYTTDYEYNSLIKQ